MGCNKEEGISAKELAETNMQNRNFSGAKKIALEVQQRLLANLENISQMIAVCDVHCCSDSKVNDQIDWYGILQVEQTADDSSIEKQYRRLALQLHPDINKFPGAEAAFKLIEEANMTLTDKSKRFLYDIKRRSVQPKAVVHPDQQSHPNMTTKSVGQNANTTCTFGNVHLSSSNPQNLPPTFWTMCPSCCAKFEYYRALLNSYICCPRCLKPYIAYELSSRNVPQPNHNFAPKPNQNVTTVHNSNNIKQQVPVQPTTKNDNAVPANVRRANASTTSTRKSRKSVAECSESDCTTDAEEEGEEIDARNCVNAGNDNLGAGHSARHPKCSCSMNQDDVKDHIREKEPNGQASYENEEISNVSPVRMENAGSKNRGDDNTNSNLCYIQPYQFYRGRKTNTPGIRSRRILRYMHSKPKPNPRAK